MGKVKPDFKQEAMWIIPTGGTWGTKARTLYENTDTILKHGFKVPRSLVLPYDLFRGEGSFFELMDAVNEHFCDYEWVAIRSSSPDEDLGGRTPGLYHSKAVQHKKEDEFGRRFEGLDALRYVSDSYFSAQVEGRREMTGLETKGMSFLVQELVPATYSGSFSDIGEIGLLTFTDPKHGLESMLRPSLDKLRVDSKGRIVSNRKTSTFQQAIAKDLRELASALPDLGEKGWELEFVLNENDKYIVQTTPIRKIPTFDVERTEKNIFNSGDVVGSGVFETKGMLYIPGLDSSFDLRAFDRENEHYCLVTVQPLLMSGNNLNILREIENADVVICVPYWISINPFSAHVEQYIREGERCAMIGSFTDAFLKQIGNESLNSEGGFGSGIAYYDIDFKVQADEIEQKSNIEVIKPTGRRKIRCTTF